MFYLLLGFELDPIFCGGRNVSSILAPVLHFFTDRIEHNLVLLMSIDVVFDEKNHKKKKYQVLLLVIYQKERQFNKQ